MFKIGLTGGIGSGKSRVADMLAEWGAALVDTDEIARALTAAGGAAMPAIEREFGREALTPAGALNRAWGFRGVAAAGSLLFGLWHIATSLGLTSSNVGFTRIFGGGLPGTIAGVVLAVAATAAAGFVFTWLRRRSGSLIAPIALHWSLNGLGALAAALVWHLST